MGGTCSLVAGVCGLRARGTLDTLPGLARGLRGGAILACLALARCSSAGAGADAGAGAEGGAVVDGGAVDSSSFDPNVVAAVCAELGKARCAKLASCSPWSMARTYPDLSTCEARDKLICPLGAPGSSDTPESVKACAAAYSSLSCNDYFDGLLPQACLPKPGSLPTGLANCVFDSQCQSGYCASHGGECGQCEVPRKPGDSCNEANFGLTRCPLGLACGGMGCFSRLALGASCDPLAYGSCAAGLGCAKSTKTCVPTVQTAGAACTVDGPPCDPYLGLVCNGQTCESRPLAGGSQLCGPLDAGVYIGDCAGGAMCPSNLQSAGSCVAPVADGASCLQAPCQAPAVCEGSTNTCIVFSWNACTL